METFGDPHLAAVLLKKYIRDLPSPIFSETMYTIIRQCPEPTSDPSDISAITYIRENILTELAPCVYILLSHVLRELYLHSEAHQKHKLPQI
jgi:Rho GTPase-activating protein 1